MTSMTLALCEYLCTGRARDLGSLSAEYRVRQVQPWDRHSPSGCVISTCLSNERLVSYHHRATFLVSHLTLNTTPKWGGSTEQGSLGRSTLASLIVARLGSDANCINVNLVAGLSSSASSTHIDIFRTASNGFLAQLNTSARNLPDSSSAAKSA